MAATRLITAGDAEVLAEIVRDSREFLAPWEPVRDDEYFTVVGQRHLVDSALARCRNGYILPHVILDESGRVAGRITLNDIVRGPFQSCNLGYWLGVTATGRGLASAAVREIIGIAFDDLGLHRIQAGTLLHNVRSQRVLERAGFTRFGLAPAYLHIAGQWQDHALYQLVNAGLGNGPAQHPHP